MATAEATRAKHLRERQQLLFEALERGSEKSLQWYLDNVVIDCVPEPKRYKVVREGWQTKRDEALVPAIEFITGLSSHYDGPRHFWYGMGKGNDKSSFIARILNWFLAFNPKKNARAYCGAKDAGQAGVIYDCMVKEAALNPWFQRRLEFKRGKVEGKVNGAQLHILTSDAEGIHGINPDFVVADELTNWRSNDLYDALFSGVYKRSGHCVFIVLTNAGFKDTWQYKLRETAEAEHGKSWHFFEAPPYKRLASWMSEEMLAQHRKMLTPSEAKRLFDNCWIDLHEDRGIFLPEDVDACVGPPTPPPPGATVYLGLDYGELHDRTALSEVWYDGDVVHVTDCVCIQGSKESPVQIDEVEGWVRRKLLQHPNAVVVMDKHQLVALEQKLQKEGVEVKRFEFAAGKLVYEMAECLRTKMMARKMRFAATAGLHYDGTTLADEFKRVIGKRTNWGYKIDHERKEHDDRVISVGMATLEAIKTSPDLAKSQLQTKPSGPSRVLRPVGGGFTEALFAKRKWFGSR